MLKYRQNPADALNFENTPMRDVLFKKCTFCEGRNGDYRCKLTRNKSFVMFPCTTVNQQICPRAIKKAGVGG